MQQKLRTKKRKWKKAWTEFIHHVTLTFKIALSLVVLFFIILFVIVEPMEIMSHDFFQSQEDVFSSSSGSIEEDFIQMIAPHAKKAEQTYGTRPSLLIAQAALESDWGRSDLSKESNNYFGIKGSASDKAYATREFNNEEWVQINASFRQYDSIDESVDDYGKLLQNGTDWDPHFYQKALEATDYKEAAKAVHEAGYATDPNYADKLIRIIEQYHLYELDF